MGSCHGEGARRGERGFPAYYERQDRLSEGLRGICGICNGHGKDHGGCKDRPGKAYRKKESRRVSRALNEALQRVYKALASNPDLSPFGALLLGDQTKGGGCAAEVQKEKEGSTETTVQTGEKKEGKEKKKRKKKPKVKKLTPNAIIKRIKFGVTGVSCVVDSFGENGPEAFSEETTIYINRDHSLYKRESAKVDTHVFNLARLITQEISLMKDLKNPWQALDRQSKLLRDAFIERDD